MWTRPFRACDACAIDCCVCGGGASVQVRSEHSFALLEIGLWERAKRFISLKESRPVKENRKNKNWNNPKIKFS